MSKGDYRRVNLTKRYVESIKPDDTFIEITDTAQKGLVLRVQPSGIKSFVCVYGRGKRKTIGRFPDTTVMMARKRCEQWRGAGVPPETKAKDTEAAALSLGEFIEGGYATFCRTHNRAPEENLKRLQTCFGQWWNWPLENITTGTVEIWRAKEKRRGTSPATINRDVGRLRKTLSTAVEWDRLDRHPLKNLKALKVDEDHVVRYLSDDEEGRLRKALETAPDYLKAMVLVSLNTGVRRKELFTLRWDRVDLQRRQMTVIGSLSKIRKIRFIPLNQEAEDTLQKWRDETGGDGLVFKSHTGSSYNNTKRSWAALLKRAKITNFRWHDLRHDFASKLVMRGADLYEVMKLLGHASISSTQKYAHLAPGHLADVVARLDR